MSAGQKCVVTLLVWGVVGLCAALLAGVASGSATWWLLTGIPIGVLAVGVAIATPLYLVSLLVAWLAPAPPAPRSR